MIVRFQHPYPYLGYKTAWIATVVLWIMASLIVACVALVLFVGHNWWLSAFMFVTDALILSFLFRPQIQAGHYWIRAHRHARRSGHELARDLA